MTTVPAVPDTDPPARSTRGWYKRNEIAITPWLFLLPGMIFFLVYVIIPIFQSFWISLHEWDGLSEAKWIGTDNYERLFGIDGYRWIEGEPVVVGTDDNGNDIVETPMVLESAPNPETGDVEPVIVERSMDSKFEVSLVNNIRWLLLYLLAIPAGLFIALFLNQTVRGIRLYKSLFFFPFVISQVVVGLVFSWFYLPNEGLLNAVVPFFDPILQAIAPIVRFFYPLYDGAMGLLWVGINIIAAALTLVLYVVIAVLTGILSVVGLASVPEFWGFLDLTRESGQLPAWLTPGWEGLGRTNILGNPNTATYGIIAAGLWPQTAYCMILYLTGLNAVDPEQIEAGRLDGARGRKMLWHVVLPQLRPATFIAFVVTIIGALRSFDFIAVMTNGGPFGSTRVLSFYMFEESLSEFGFRMGYGAAIAVVLFFIMLFFIVYFLYSMWRDEQGGR